MDLDNTASPEDLPDAPITPPIEVDLRYNVAVCTECCTGVAFDHIQSHLGSVHGISKQLDEVMEDLSIDTPTLSATEIEAWMSELWVLDRGIQGVPAKEGMRCTECEYCCAAKQPMKNHFTSKHRGLKWAENVLRCSVQMPFQGRLKKYIQIEDTDGEGVETDAGNEWKQALDQEFHETMGERTSSGATGHSDARLLSAFIAKLRWDLCVKDMELVELVKLAATPVRSDRLHKVILCGREYIDKCCEALNGGNIMLKRRLMSAGYISSVNKC